MHRLLNGLAFAQPYFITLLVAAVALMFMPGCTTTGATTAGGTRDLATTGVTTAAGAYIGSRAGNGKAADAVLGASAGFIAGEAINYFNNRAQREAYLAGYEKGQSDAIKQQYWIARDNQHARNDDGYAESLYEINVPASNQNGVLREPTTRVIRVVVPKEEPTP